MLQCRATAIMIKNDTALLEQSVEALIKRCLELSAANKKLRDQVSSQVLECKNLREKNTLVLNKLKQLMEQFKAIESI